MYGWILQSHFEHSIKTSVRPVDLFDNAGNVSLQLPVAAGSVQFYHESDMSPAAIVPDGWLIPVKVNQGCYDAVQMLWDPRTSKWTLRVIQVTCSDSHYLKMAYLHNLLEWLLRLPVAPVMAGLEVIVVVPQQAIGAFKSAPVTGVSSLVRALQPWARNYRIGMTGQDVITSNLVRVLGMKTLA
jgi:hypothetical protein